MTACCGPTDGFEIGPGGDPAPNAEELGSRSRLAQSKIPPRTRGEWPVDPAFAVALARSRPERGGSGPIWPGAALKKVAPAYLSRLTAAPTRRKTAE